MFLTVGDLSPLTKAADEVLALMIEDVEALAVDAAPCLSDQGLLTEAQVGAVRAVLRAAALRWADYSTRDDRQLTAGPYSIGPAQGSSGERKPLLWPSEITQLQAICAVVSGRTWGRVGQVKLAAPPWWVR